MLQEAEEAEAEKKEAEEEAGGESAAPVKRKAKTKFGSKKKKKKTKTTSKFPGGDEDGYEVITVMLLRSSISLSLYGSRTKWILKKTGVESASDGWYFRTFGSSSLLSGRYLREKKYFTKKLRKAVMEEGYDYFLEEGGTLRQKWINFFCVKLGAKWLLFRTKENPDIWQHKCVQPILWEKGFKYFFIKQFYRFE